MGKYDIVHGVQGPDILGHGYDDMHGVEGDVGASSKGMQKGAPHGGKMGRHHVRAHGPGGTQLVEDPDGQHLRKQLAPIPPAILAAAGIAGSVTTVLVQVQRIFRMERLVLNSSLNALSQTVITQVNVGQDPQFVNSGSVPVQMFFNQSFDVGLRGNTAYPGLLLAIGFQNNGPSADTITGGITGEAVPE